MRLIIYSIILLFFFTSCSNINEEEKIYSIIINEVIKPIPPPPPPNVLDTVSVINREVIDSIASLPMQIAVSSKLLGFKFKNNNTSLIDKINKGEIEYYESKLLVKKELLVGRKNLSFDILSEIELKNILPSKKYDGLLKLSNIEYDETKNQALVVASYSVGRLSGNIIMIYLEKKSNSWVIVKSRSLSVS